MYSAYNRFWEKENILCSFSNIRNSWVYYHFHFIHFYRGEKYIVSPIQVLVITLNSVIHMYKNQQTPLKVKCIAHDISVSKTLKIIELFLCTGTF